MSEPVEPESGGWEQYEKSFGLSAAFFATLEKDNDWSFVIKVHALIEAALNKLITAALGDNRLMDIVTRLDTGDTRRGKIAFVSALELLPKGDRQFISIMSQLRNEVAHDVSQVEFSFSAWIAKLPTPQFDTFVRSVSRSPDDVKTDETLMTERKKHMRQFPTPLIRSIILLGCMRIAWRTLDDELSRFVAPLINEAERLEALVASFEAGKQSTPKES